MWGEDAVFMIWDVRNVCSRDFRMRVEHQGDFLPIVITKDGEPWLAYPNCFGQGDPYERSFSFGNGLRQGWMWIGLLHDEWVRRCEADPFDPDAEYAVVGYGASEVPATDITWSDVIPLSEPMIIELLPP
ncbi:MAG: hypothetical protein CMH57_01865 [Myxococcales bacterium]|nr:hypothetical protein [Myxococcales bacterium]